jgi:hypothetical protein
MRKLGVFARVNLLAVCVILTGCVTIPPDILKMPAEQLANRQLQTRAYETVDEEKILAACSGALQDLGFTLDKSETRLGLIFASKDRKVDNTGQIVTATLLTALSSVGGSGASYNYYNDVEKNQKIRASVVSQKSQDGSSVLVRVTFQRMVWNMAGQLSRIQTLKEPDLYEGFFEKLSKSVFLEEQKI